MPLSDISNEAPSPYSTAARVIYVESPASGDSFPIGFTADAATLTAVRAVTDTGTVDFNIEKRAKLTPDAAGTDVWSADKQATASGLEQTSFDSPAVDSDTWLHFAASAVSGATKLWISVEYMVV